MGKYVTLPRDMVLRALRKARSEYVRVAVQQGTNPGPDDECWAEFEALQRRIEDIDFDRAMSRRAKHIRKLARK